jgi:predicted lipoprotein with Yx(FWY)xxD motif
MKSPFIYAGVALGLALGVSACGGSTYGTPSTGPAAPSKAPNGYTATTIGVTTTKIGQFLVDDQGRTLYLFEADKGTTSNCDGACAQAWPPLLTSAGDRAGSGVSAAELGTTTRKDGSTQATYNGHPLYYFVADRKPGDTTGQGLNQFGAPWYVVSPAGNKIGNS